MHRYYRWQIHSLLRLVLVLVFCGVLISLLPVGLTQATHKIVAGGSTILFIYAVSNWWRISNEDKANRRICSNGEGDGMLDAFAELSQSAFRQAMAFALIFGMNIGLQVVEFIDTENRFALNGELEGQNPLDAPWFTDLTKPLG